ARQDERAGNWIRVADFSRRHFSLIASVYHLYQAYETNRTMANLKQVGKAVQEAQAGRVEFRLDRLALMHMPVGKASFEELAWAHGQMTGTRHPHAKRPPWVTD
ncbi:MAG: hypothetical protein IH940_05015, partial [Acidobacteria bacterium]|nr:hypothetical protein [Acidobacteriota bacterium]